MVKIPPGCAPLRHKRLTLIKLLSDLGDRLESHKEAAKSAAGRKAKSGETIYLESDLAVARVSQLAPRRFAEPALLWEMVKRKRLTVDQFLACLCVRTSLLPAILSGEEIESITPPSTAQPTLALYPDYKPGVRVELDAIEAAIETALAEQTN